MGYVMTMSIHSVPQDIIDRIIGEVDDIATLKICAIVAPSFLHPSRKKLFHTIHFDAEYGSVQCARLNELFSSQPDLCDHVRRLSLLDVGDTIASIMDDMVDNDHLSSWIPRDAALPALLGKLHRLESFELDCDRGFLAWYKFKDDLKSSLLNLFDLNSSLTSLSFGHIVKLPLFQLNQFPRIKKFRFSFSEAIFGPIQPIILSVIPQPLPVIGHLQSLDLTRASDTLVYSILESLLDPSSRLDLTELRELSVSLLSPTGVRSIHEMMRTTSGSVQSLTWTTDYFPEFSNFPGFDIGIFSDLRCIRVALPFGPLANTPLDPVPWVLSSFKTRTRSSIRTVIFHYCLSSACQAEDLLKFCSSNRWAELDAVFSKDSYPSLENVTIFIHVYFASSLAQVEARINGMKILETIRDNLPLLRSRNALSLQEECGVGQSLEQLWR